MCDIIRPSVTNEEGLNMNVMTTKEAADFMNHNCAPRAISL